MNLHPIYEFISESSKRLRLMVFLILATPRAYSVNELSRRLGITPGILKADLHALQDKHLVKSFSVRGVKLYMLNVKSPAVGELKTTLTKTHKPFEDELFAAIKHLGDVKAAFLSGVFSGQAHLPVDLLIVGKPNLTKLDQFLQASKRMVGCEINYSIMSEGEFKNRRDTFDRFIKDIFDYTYLVVVDQLK